MSLSCNDPLAPITEVYDKVKEFNDNGLLQVVTALSSNPSLTKQLAYGRSVFHACQGRFCRLRGRSVPMTRNEFNEKRMYLVRKIMREIVLV